MKRSLALVSALVGLAAAASVALAQESISLPKPTLQFGGTGVKTAIGELKASPAYGDLSKGQHGTFIRMPAGFVSPLHTHTEDYFGIVIEGIAVNEQGTKNTVELPVGSYWFQKGREKHVTKCVAKTDCLFFIYQPGKFDYVPAN